MEEKEKEKEKEEKEVEKEKEEWDIDDKDKMKENEWGKIVRKGRDMIKEKYENIGKEVEDEEKRLEGKNM